MSKEDFYSILISTTEFYLEDASYVPWFKKYKVSTIGDLFNIEKMRPIVNAVELDTIAEIKVLLHTIKFKYLGKAMSCNDILGKRIGIMSPSLPLELCFTDGRYFNLCFFLGIPDAYYSSLMYLLGRDEKLMRLIKETNFKVVDLLKWIRDNYFYVPFIDIIKAFIESYESTLGDIDSINKKTK